MVLPSSGGKMNVEFSFLWIKMATPRFTVITNFRHEITESIDVPDWTTIGYSEIESRVIVLQFMLILGPALGKCSLNPTQESIRSLTNQYQLRHQPF